MKECTDDVPRNIKLLRSVHVEGAKSMTSSLLKIGLCQRQCLLVLFPWVICDDAMSCPGNHVLGKGMNLCPPESLNDLVGSCPLGYTCDTMSTCFSGYQLSSSSYDI